MRPTQQPVQQPAPHRPDSDGIQPSAGASRRVRAVEARGEDFEPAGVAQRGWWHVWPVWPGLSARGGRSRTCAAAVPDDPPARAGAAGGPPLQSITPVPMSD
jgi:hypothetical protein